MMFDGSEDSGSSEILKSSLNQKVDSLPQRRHQTSNEKDKFGLYFSNACHFFREKNRREVACPPIYLGPVWGSA